MGDGISVHVPISGVDDGEVALKDEYGNYISVEKRDGEYNSGVYDSESHQTLKEILTTMQDVRALLIRILE
jgi:hypothetical protein